MRSVPQGTPGKTHHVWGLLVSKPRSGRQLPLELQDKLKGPL